MLLAPVDLAHRASVHFLVTMLEAYYFADARAVNAVLQTQLTDYAGDVEGIRNPKAKLRHIFPEFHEVDHGGQILQRLDLPHVLSRKETCPSLRTLVAWCAKAIQLPFADEYRLADGELHGVTSPQLERLA